MIGDLPTRFKYSKVTPESFGLTAAEILEKSDKELNQIVGLKTLAPYRPMSKAELKAAKYKTKLARWGKGSKDSKPAEDGDVA